MRVVLECPVLLTLAIMLQSGGTTWAQQSPGASPKRPHRRIILNDDGEVILPAGDRSWDDYLGERFTDAVGTQVDSYFLNVAATDRGPGIRNSIQSSLACWAGEGKLPALYAEAARRYIQAAREANIEIFASIRMNDVHDSRFASAAELNYPLKVKRPDLLLGAPEGLERGRGTYPSDSVMAWFWPGLERAARLASDRG